MKRSEARVYGTIWARLDYSRNPEKYKAASARYRASHPKPKFIGPRQKPGSRKRSHCKWGHDLTPENLYEYTNKHGEHVRQCKMCVTIKNANRKQNQRDNHLKRNYGITQAQYDTLLAVQGGRCKVSTCRTTDPGGMGSFHIDHDHRCCSGKKCCGKCIRGLLCNRCNTVLGRVLDSVDILNGLIQYLDSQPAFN